MLDRTGGLAIVMRPAGLDVATVADSQGEHGWWRGRRDCAGVPTRFRGVRTRNRVHRDANVLSLGDRSASMTGSAG
jgi:hypothetical protein